MIEMDRAYRALIKADIEGNAEAAQKIRRYLAEHNIQYHGNIIRTLQIPKIYSKEDVQRFREIVHTTYGIFEKVIQRYLDDPDYRTQFPFSKELEELILVPRGYASLLPVARFDIFYNEENGDFKFCEINTDGTSAMNEDRVLNQALAELNPAHLEMMKRHRFAPFELMDSWVSTCLSIYQGYDKRVDDPYVAIVDFLDGVEIAEFEEFARRFQRAGVRCEVCEITKLRYSGGRLYSPTGHAIDLIYRRVVTTDVMAHMDELTPFLSAVRDRSVCIIGAFCTQVVHNKWLFALLHEEETRAMLSADECAFIDAHVPMTHLLSADSIPAITADKDKWLIKPLDSYASKGVYAGRDLTQEEWAARLMEYAGSDYIYQEFCAPYRTDNIDFIEKEPAFATYANMAGLYVYNGEFAGVYSRQSAGNIISSQYNERDNASLMLLDD